MKKLFAPIALLTCCVLLSVTEVPEKIKTNKDFVYIPAGTQQTGELVSSFHPFLMLNHEVTNGEYRKFLNHLKAENRMEDLTISTPDTSAWNFREGGYFDPMVAHYFSHPAYENYPVVNITAEGVQLYCEYLTQELRKEYGDDVMVKLPTEKQWQYAASGGQERNDYSWSGMGLRDAKGHYRANYYSMGDESITRDAEGNFAVSSDAGGSWYEDGAVFTAPSISYSVNGYGLYNMCGNVSEMVSDGTAALGGDWYSPGFDIRIASKKPVEKPLPYIGFRPIIIFE